MKPMDEAPADWVEMDIVDLACALFSDMRPEGAEKSRRGTFERVEQAKREWESTADSLPELICLVDRHGRLIRANRTVESWKLGRVGEVRGRRPHDLLHAACADLACPLNAFLKRATDLTLQGQSAEWEADDPILARHIRISARPVPDRDRVRPQAAVIVVHDVTESKRAEEALRQAALELQARNDELSAFAHTVAHDLKNPLTSLLLHIDLLREKRVDISPELRQAHIDDLAQVGQKMVNIVDELLLLAEVRQAEVRMAPLDMACIVDNARLRLADLISRSEAEISLPAAWPAALGYAPWVEEVWVNYLSNGLKYGGQPPRLELGSSGPADGLLRYWVRDNGPGIPPAEQGRLFMPFTRLDQARASGHGLGLSIVQRIVNKLNGTVSVESEGVAGRGCVFSFSLPASSAVQSQCAAAIASASDA